MNQGKDMDCIVSKLLAKKVSKYKIAKVAGVSWQTVHMWSLGVFKPKADKIIILEGLLNENN